MTRRNAAAADVRRPTSRLRRAPFAVALLTLVALALSGCGFSGLYSAPLPGGASVGSHPYTLTGYFADVLDLVPQSAVKVNDVPVGKVTGIELKDCKTKSSSRGKWCAKVTMQVQNTVDLPANARAEIKQTSLLGEKYVSLENPTGPSVGTLRNKSKIAYDDTSSAPEVEQVLGALSLLLNEGGLTQIRVIASELNKAIGTRQRQQAARDLIKQLNTFTGTLDKQKAEITSALDSVNRLAHTLNTQKSIITDALATFPQALSVLRQNTPAIVHLLSALSRLGGVATRVINETQQPLVSSLRKLAPALDGLTASGDDLPKALRILLTFPFPIGKTLQFVKGDYANLDVGLNLNLQDELCGLLGVGCANDTSGAGSALTTNSARSSKVTQGTPASDATSAQTTTGTQQSLPPTLVGAGS